MSPLQLQVSRPSFPSASVPSLTFEGSSWEPFGGLPHGVDWRGPWCWRTVLALSASIPLLIWLSLQSGRSLDLSPSLPVVGAAQYCFVPVSGWLPAKHWFVQPAAVPFSASQPLSAALAQAPAIAVATGPAVGFFSSCIWSITRCNSAKAPGWDIKLITPWTIDFHTDILQGECFLLQQVWNSFASSNCFDVFFQWPCIYILRCLSQWSY